MSKEKTIEDLYKEKDKLWKKYWKICDEITKKEYSISSRFLLDDSQLEMSKVRTVMKNGLLYIIFPIKEEKEEQSEIEIAIK